MPALRGLVLLENLAGDVVYVGAVGRAVGRIVHRGQVAVDVVGLHRESGLQPGGAAVHAHFLVGAVVLRIGRGEEVGVRGAVLHAHRVADAVAHAVIDERGVVARRAVGADRAVAHHVPVGVIGVEVDLLAFLEGIEEPLGAAVRTAAHQAAGGVIVAPVEHQAVLVGHRQPVLSVVGVVPRHERRRGAEYRGAGFVHGGRLRSGVHAEIEVAGAVAVQVIGELVALGGVDPDGATRVGAFDYGLAVHRVVGKPVIVIDGDVAVVDVVNGLVSAVPDPVVGQGDVVAAVVDQREPAERVVADVIVLVDRPALSGDFQDVTSRAVVAIGRLLADRVVGDAGELPGGIVAVREVLAAAVGLGGEVVEPVVGVGIDRPA